MDDSQSAPPTAATGNAKSMVAAAKGRVAGPGGRRVSPGRSRRSPGRSPSPGRRSPSPDSVKFFGTGASAFQSSEPRSALFRTNTNPSFLYDYSLTVDPNSAAYRYYKTAKAAVLTKTNVPAQDTLVPRAQSPPVGTYNIPTFPPELKLSEKRPSSSFRSSGRASAFIENSTMFYKSLRDETALTNIGPGSYNLSYTWRTDDHNYAHTRAISSAPAGLGGGGLGHSSSTFGRVDSPSASRMCCLHKAHPPGQYEKPWLTQKAPLPPLSPRTRTLAKLQEIDDVAAVRGLPSY